MVVVTPATVHTTFCGAPKPDIELTEPELVLPPLPQTPEVVSLLFNTFAQLLLITINHTTAKSVPIFLFIFPSLLIYQNRSRTYIDQTSHVHFSGIDENQAYTEK